MRLAAFVAFLLCAPLVFAATPGGGGRDVSVALFSTHPVQRVSVTPLGPNAWYARCGSCPHMPFTQPMTIAKGTDMFAGGNLRIADEATHETRTAAGLWHLKFLATSQSVDVVLTLPSERYVTAVLNAEAAHDEPPASLQALAIVARTYALNGKHYTAQPGHLDADLCDSTQCQAMLLQAPSQAVEDAVRATAGETVWFGPRRAEVYFSQDCGGLTEDAGAVWPRLKGLPYLQSHADPYCQRRPSSAWHAQVPLATFLNIAKQEGWRVPADLATVQVDLRSASHRALRILLTGRNGASTTLSASAVRFGIGRALGWNQVRSDSYQLGLRNGALIFDGRGHGHGVGLCQVGAAEMAKEGKNAAEILGFYFPGTDVRILPNDHGWQQFGSGALVIRSTDTITSAQQDSFLQIWQEARHRFPPAHDVVPTIVLPPSTEVFRQMTSEPGWMLASTQGDKVVLQPAAAFHPPASTQKATLLHEMLHVAVETACNARTPLWLREGIVEVLSGERLVPSKVESINAIESTLQHPESLQQSQRAHAAAGTKVKLLIERYGVTTVRGWLSSGVPAGVS